MRSKSLLPAGWNPKHAGDRVLGSLANVCLPTVRGAHDSDFLVCDGKAYVVYMANDVQPGENPEWPFVYSALSVVDVATGRVERTETFAASEKKYENDALPVGACFVPRIIRKDERTLRCFFASEEPGKRESQTWYVDFDLARQTFDWTIRRVELETREGVFPMRPQYFYRQAAREGFALTQHTCGLYMIDSFKVFEGRIHAVVNNFSARQTAWAAVNDELTRVSILGNFFLPPAAHLSESAVNRLPDGTWLAISRQENRDQNYMFAQSRDGIHWSPHEYRTWVSNGANSKPTFDRLGGAYYLGWQEATRINGAFRSVFNLDVSRDGQRWERKYRFETEKSFQYPVFRESGGTIYLSVTQGDTSEHRKERIMFGPLETPE
jgi:hypothetical protein